MLKSVRNACYSTTMVMTPFLLTACGGDDNGQHKKVAIAVVALLCFTFTLLGDQFKARQKF